MTNSSALKLKHNTIQSRLNSNKYYLVPINRMEDARWFLDQVYEKIDDTNFISIFTKHNGTEEQWSLPYSQLIQEKNLMNILSLTDTYISINTTWKIGRKQRDVRRLNACFVDLDYYKVKGLESLEPPEIIKKMRDRGLFDDLEPSFFVNSGRGMYIFYLLKNCSKDVSKLYRKIQNTLVEKFKDFGADVRARDISRVLRIPGTIHSYNNWTAKIIYNSDKPFRFQQRQEQVRRYLIDDLAKAFLPELPYTKEEWLRIKKERKKKKKEAVSKPKRKVVSLFNKQTLYFNRIKDLEILQQLRGIEAKGHREFMCYLYRLWQLHLTSDASQALQNTLVFNSGFAEPLDEQEVIEATIFAEENYSNYVKAIADYDALPEKPFWAKFAYDRGCNLYSNKTLIQDLEITLEEERELRTIISKEMKQERRNEANKVYYQSNKEELREKRKKRYKEAIGTSKKDKKEEERQKIKSLLAEGFKRKTICTQLGISIETYKRRIKEMKQEGLLQ